ncbi:uracil-DNA glycosylase [Nocardioides glacieisoli]|uniref:Uracil-DNA glycosylase n=2 Tax=Nocardioidaceae TaxID=85015 RepID=A0A4Q2RKX6_9ACTN|nr:uracil-DNA glycosylase [Nocardioides glacieisoli]GIM64260.1 hypothetical protein Pve01_94690 [Planomonospora venezuelensis]
MYGMSKRSPSRWPPDSRASAWLSVLRPWAGADTVLPDPASKRARVHDDPVGRLNELAERWRLEGPSNSRFVPWFDPDGAGTKAQVLLLMEAPGPRTVAAGDLGFSSLDNDDPTTRQVHRALTSSNLDQARCLRWNVVPWALTGPEGRLRAPRVDDLEDARPALSALLAELVDLRVVVTFGGAALEGWMRYLTLAEHPVVVPTLAVPHPSPANGHRRQEALQRTTAALERAADLCGRTAHS